MATYVYPVKCLQWFEEPLKKIVFWRDPHCPGCHDTASLEYRSVKKNDLRLSDIGKCDTLLLVDPGSLRADLVIVVEFHLFQVFEGFLSVVRPFSNLTKKNAVK